jgi:Archaeal ADP-dependent phosphofructokinase/glucokinase
MQMEKLVLGLGNNIDYEIVWDSRVFESLIEKYDIRDAELSKDVPIDSERNMVISILGFVKADMGGERYVQDPQTIEDIAQYFQKKITLGGTSVRAAIAMRRLGYRSALHLVTINDDVRRLIPSDSPYVCSAKEDSCYPHFIVQYTKGTRIQASDVDICAARSNRIIYTHDEDNALMALDSGLKDMLTRAEVFLISGFNSMQDESLLQQRLLELVDMMVALPDDALVYYEDGGFHRPELSRMVQEKLISRIDIYSMNEDELQAYLNRKIDLLNADEMATALRDVHRMIPATTLLIHTQHYALTYGEQAARYCNALRSAIVMAGTRFCFGDDFTMDDHRAVSQYPLQVAGETFAHTIQGQLKDNICCCACVQADERNATTIGLGDSFVGGFLPALLD